MSEIPHTRPSGQRMRSDVFADDVWVGTRPAFGPVAAPRVAKGEAWWSQTGSNRRPHACKARALPAELWPRNQKTNALHRLLRRFSLQERKRTRSNGGPGKT